MREVMDEPLMSESEKTTWLAMADREGEYGWLPEPEWSPAREVGGAGGKADALSLSPTELRQGSCPFDHRGEQYRSSLYLLLNYRN
jgi:hypothetical protein